MVNQQNNLHIIGLLPKLIELRLISFTSAKLEFLAVLSNLRSLTFLLGSTEDLKYVSKIPRLETLELDWIRRLSDLSFIESCANLINLKLEKLRQVKELPNLSKLKKLKSLTLTDLKGLSSVDAVSLAPNLENLNGNNCGLAPEVFSCVLDAPELKEANIYFPTNKAEKLFNTKATELGITT